jgi:hypothetical protein
MGDPIPLTAERAWCPFYALDDLGLVAASVLTTSQEIGLRVAAQLIGGLGVELPGTVLRRQREVRIPLPADASGSERHTQYNAAYTRTHPLRLETGAGYETCVLHRDATMQAALDHWGYLLRLPGESEDHFRARFLHLWGQVTGLPTRPAWSRSLWNAGLRQGLIVPLVTFGCEGWRVDPRRSRPGGTMGWGEVLQLLAIKETA